MCRRARSRPETLKPRVSGALAPAVALSGVHALARTSLLRSGKSVKSVPSASRREGTMC